MLYLHWPTIEHYRRQKRQWQLPKLRLSWFLGFSSCISEKLMKSVSKTVGGIPTRICQPWLPCVRKISLSWIVVYPNIWDKTSGQPWETSFASIPKTSPLIDQRCHPSIVNQMCFSIPRCLWVSTEAIFGVDLHVHTHARSLSVSPSVCSLSSLSSPLHFK